MVLLEPQAITSYRSMQSAQELLDIQRVSTVHGRTSLYAVSYAAIRSVASGGKVCLLALDTRGAETLYHDDRIDAAFVYVNAPSWQELETRVAKRLREDESTVQKRIAWAQEEVCAFFPNWMEFGGSRFSKLCVCSKIFLDSRVSLFRSVVT